MNEALPSTPEPNLKLNVALFQGKFFRKLLPQKTPQNQNNVASIFEAIEQTGCTTESFEVQGAFSSLSVTSDQSQRVR